MSRFKLKPFRLQQTEHEISIQKELFPSNEKLVTMVGTRQLKIWNREAQTQGAAPKFIGLTHCGLPDY